MITGSHNPKNYNGIKLIINDVCLSVEIYNLINQSLDISENNGKIISKDFKEEYQRLKNIL